MRGRDSSLPSPSSASHRSTASAIRPLRPGGSTGSRHPNRSPDDLPPPAMAFAASDSHVSSSVRDASSRRFQSRGPSNVEGQSFGSSPLPSRSTRRSSACRHRNSAASATSAGSSSTNSVSEAMWSSAVAGARSGAQTSAASPTAAARVSPWVSRPRRAIRRGAPGPGRAGPGASCRIRPTIARSSSTPPAGTGTPTRAGAPRRSTLPVVALVGRVEGPERVDLVAERLDANRELRRGREDVDDAAAARELAAAGDLEDRLVAQLEELAQQRRLRDPRRRPAARAAAPGRSSGGDRVLDQRLDAGHEDPRPPASPRRERRDARRRLVRDQLASLVGQRGPRLQDGDCRWIAGPRSQLLRDAIADLRVARDPDDPLPGDKGEGRREVALGAVRHRGDAGVPSGGRRRRRDRAEPLPERLERTRSPDQPRQRREVRDPPAGALALRYEAPRRCAPTHVACASISASAESNAGRSISSRRTSASPSASRRSQPRRPRIGGLLLISNPRSRRRRASARARGASRSSFAERRPRRAAHRPPPPGRGGPRPRAAARTS